jgi:hypothetical protein
MNYAKFATLARRFWRTKGKLLVIRLSVFVIFLFPTSCGKIWGTVARISKEACQDPVVTGSCGGIPPFARVQVVPATCPQGTLCHIITATNTDFQNIIETSGNLLVAFAYAGQNAHASHGGTAPNMVFTVTDTLGNTFYPGPYVNNGKYNDSAIQIFYAPNIIGGVNTVTVNSTAGDGAQSTGIVLLEYSGLATTDVVDIASGQAAPASLAVATAGSITARSACDLVVGGMANGHVFLEPDTAGAGWVEPVLDEWDPAAFVDNVAVGTSFGSTADISINLAGGADDGWAATQIAFRSSSAPAMCQPSQLAFATAPQSVGHGTCSGVVTVQSQNSSGLPVITSAGINLTLSGAGLTFYSDSSCAFPTTSVLIGAGTSSTSFYYEAAAAGSPVISCTATGLSAFSQTETSL